MKSKNKYKRQVAARLIADEDEHLDDEISPYAEHGQQGDVIRLALYRLFGLELPASLTTLADELGGGDMAVSNDEAQAIWVALEATRSELKGAIDDVRHDVAELRRYGIQDSPPPDAGNGRGDDPRQAILSAKLKGINFADLTH